MSGTVQANDGAMLPLDSLPITLAYSGSFVSTITTVYQGNTYVQTFTNNGTNITEISGWINSNFFPPGSDIVAEDGSTQIVSEGGLADMVTEY
jgi:hypothetical protein